MGLSQSATDILAKTSSKLGCVRPMPNTSVAVVSGKEDMMKRPRKMKGWKKVVSAEMFSIQENRGQPNLYRSSWRDTAGKRHRVRIHAATLEDALTQARVLVEGSCRKQDSRGLKVLDAFNEALRQTDRGERSTRDWNRDVDRFLEWLGNTHPGCTYWGMVSRRIFRQYLSETLSGNADNTRRLRMQPIVQTSRYMETEHDVPSACRDLKIGNKLTKTPPWVQLADVSDLLDYAVERDIRIAVGIALQGLAGFRLLEALRLNWGSVDLKSGLVEVSGKVKNRYSNRCIPVCSRVTETLWLCREQVYGSGVIPNPGDPVVPSPRGVSYMSGNDSYTNYSRRLKKIIKGWNCEVNWAPKDLRNAVPTFGNIRGIFSALWDQYLGHAPRSVTERHYTPRLAAATRGEKEALEKQMELFRKLIVDRVDAEVAHKVAQSEVKDGTVL